MDTFIDGCGVVHDKPIGKGTRIRFKIDDDRIQDITVYVEDGLLHVLGMNRPLFVEFIEDNHFAVETDTWENQHG